MFDVVIVRVIVLLMEEILHHLGCKNPVNNGKDYQPQLVSRISSTVSSPLGSNIWIVCRGQPHWCGLHQIWLQWKRDAGWVWTCCHATRHLENCLEEPKKPSQICGLHWKKNPWRFSQTWSKYLASIATLQIGNELKWGTRGVPQLLKVRTFQVFFFWWGGNKFHTWLENFQDVTLSGP